MLVPPATLLFGVPEYASKETKTMRETVKSPRVILMPPLDLDQVRDWLEASRHVVVVRAGVLRDALDRQRTSKHLESEVNVQLLEPYGLCAVRLGDEPVRAHTAFVIYDRRSLVGRLVDQAHLPPAGLLEEVAAEVAELEASACARTAGGVGAEPSAGLVR